MKSNTTIDTQRHGNNREQNRSKNKQIHGTNDIRTPTYSQKQTDKSKHDNQKTCANITYEALQQNKTN